MNKNIKKCIMTALAVVLIVLGFMPGSVFAEIKLGLVPRLSATELRTMFTPLAAYLSKETGDKVSIVFPKDLDSFKDMVRGGQMDMALSNPIIYVQLKKEVDVALLAVSAEGKAGTKSRGIILVRKDSGIEKLQDLKGKRLIFVDKNSVAGYIYPLLLLSKAGLDVRKDFTTLPFAKKHDNVALAVFNKTADAGSIREDDYDKMKDKIDLSQIKIVDYTDYFPNLPMFAAAKMDKNIAAKIKAALLKLTSNNPETAKVLGPAMLTGFAPVADKDFDQLREAAKLVDTL